MRGYDTNEMIKEIFNTLLRRYQEGLEESIKVVILCLTLYMDYTTSFTR